MIEALNTTGAAMLTSLSMAFSSGILCWILDAYFRYREYQEWKSEQVRSHLQARINNLGGI